VVRGFQRQLGEQLRFVFRNFPLTEIHPHALHVALAAETAAAQGVFWEMHEALFHNQHALEVDDLADLTEQPVPDLSTFVRDLAEQRYPPYRGGRGRGRTQRGAGDRLPSSSTACCTRVRGSWSLCCTRSRRRAGADPDPTPSSAKQTAHL
jgi:hypothetical protein